MALELNGKNLTGVYEDQEEPIVLDDAKELGPFVISSSLYDDSVELKFFFDPSKSDIIKRDKVNCNQITLVQSGWFSINHSSVSEDYHHKDTPYSIIRYGKNFYPVSTWMDIPSLDSNSNKIEYPFYPYWSLATAPSSYYKTDGSFDYTNSNPRFYKYPQEFGGFTKYPLPSDCKKGDNLCAFMKSHHKLTLGDIPSEPNDWDKFIEYIGGTDNLNGIKINLDDFDETKKIDIQKIITFLKGGKHISTSDYSIYPTDSNFADNYFIIKIQPNYRYNFRMTLQRKKYWPFLDKGYAIVYKKDHKLNFSYLDSEEINSYAESFGLKDKTLSGKDILYDPGKNISIGLEGKPDIEKIKKDILREYDMVLMDLENPDDFRISYTFATYAIGVNFSNIESNQVDMKTFEGLHWKISREYKSGKWQDVEIEEPELLSSPTSEYRIKCPIRDFLDYYVKKGIKIKWH